MSTNMQNPQQRVLLESGTNEVEFLEFFMGDGRYGVNVAKVNQVMVLSDVNVAEIPGNEESAAMGMAMFRDEPILVIDLAKALHLSTSQADANNNRRLLLVLEFNRRVTGFVIDRVNAIRRITWEDFMQTDDASLGTQTKWITGLFNTDDGMTLIIDFESLLGRFIPSITPDQYVDDVKKLASAADHDLNIVYCEDSEIVQKVAMRAFEQAGFKNISLFTSGREALENLLSGKCGEVDIIVSDIEMPGMDGLTLCKNLKSDNRFSSIPVVFFSSTINDQMKQKCTSVGAEAAFSKPEIHLLINSLEGVLAKKG